MWNNLKSTFDFKLCRCLFVIVIDKSWQKFMAFLLLTFLNEINGRNFRCIWIYRSPCKISIHYVITLKLYIITILQYLPSNLYPSYSFIIIDALFSFSGYRLGFNYLKAKRFVDAIDVCHKVRFIRQISFLILMFLPSLFLLEMLFIRTLYRTPLLFTRLDMTSQTYLSGLIAL